MSFWDRISGFYDLAESFNKKVYQKMTLYTAKLIPNASSVLDCAAGTGELSLAAAVNACHVMCTDQSEKMLNIARKKAKEEKITNISFEARDIFGLKDSDESYDTVIAGNVLHLLEEPEKAVKELYRVTKQGGKLILPTFVTGEKNLIVLKLYKLIGFRPTHEYTAREYCEMLKRCGCGKVKAVLIKGKISCCFAVISKPKVKTTQGEMQ